MFLKAHMKGKAGETAQQLTLAAADDPGAVSSTHTGWLSTACNCPFLWATSSPHPHKHTHIKWRYIIKRHTRAVTCWALPKCCKMHFFFLASIFANLHQQGNAFHRQRGCCKASLKMEFLWQGDSILHLRRQAEWIICSWSFCTIYRAGFAF